MTTTAHLRHILSRVFLAWAHLVSAILPPTRGFSARRAVLQLAGLQIGEGTRIAGGARFHHSNVIIGKGSWVGTACHFFSTGTAVIRIGSYVDIAPGCFFVTGSHAIGAMHRRAGKGVSRSIAVGDGTWIGANSTLLDGTTIGKGCIIAAGAVVRGSFPDNVMIGGVPARVLRELPEEEDQGLPPLT